MQGILDAYKYQGHMLTMLVFATLISTIFVLSLGNDPLLLKKIGLAVMWTVALLSTLISIPAIIKEDADDGTLLTMYAEGLSALAIYATKAIIHWFSYMLPLLFFLPCLAIFFHIPSENIIFFIIAFMISGCIISMFSAVIASILANTYRSDSLASILLLPLYVPVTIFGVYSSTSQSIDYIIILLGMACIMLPFCSIVGTIAIKFLLEKS